MSKKEYFKTLALPTLIYAILFTFLLYDNWGSITMPIFIITTLGYTFYIMKKMNTARKKETKLYAVILLLLGISDMLTGNNLIIFFNNFGIFLVLIRMLIHNFQDDQNWSFEQHAASIPAAILGAIAGIGDPFADMLEAKTKGDADEDRERLGSVGAQVIFGIIIAIPLLIAIISLLASADSVFANIMSNMFKFDWHISTIIQIAVMLVFGFLSAYCGMRYLRDHKMKSGKKTHPQWEPVVAITIFVMVSVVYVVFSIIQILFLFWGKMQLPDGYTYAGYAREGFFQLLVVCMLNLVMVLFTSRYFKNNKLLNVLMTVISVCTYIMLASSAFRMILYIQNYNLTFMRVLVLWALAVMAILLAGILVQVYKENFHLFQFALAVVCVGYLLLSFAHVDYWIAKYDLSAMNAKATQGKEQTNTKDEENYWEGGDLAALSYLSTLSSDAAPAIVGNSGNWVDDYILLVAHSTDDSWRQFNVSRFIANELFNEEIKVAWDQITIKVMNCSGEKISDVSMYYELSDGTSGTQSVSNADGSIITLESYGDSSQNLDRSSQVFTMTNEDFGLKFNSGKIPDELKVVFSFTNENGEQCSTEVYEWQPHFGIDYTLTLFKDETNQYNVYME